MKYEAPFKAVKSNRHIRNGWEILDANNNWIAWCSDNTKDMLIKALDATASQQKDKDDIQDIISEVERLKARIDLLIDEDNIRKGIIRKMTEHSAKTRAELSKAQELLKSTTKERDYLIKESAQRAIDNTKAQDKIKELENELYCIAGRKKSEEKAKQEQTNEQ